MEIFIHRKWIEFIKKTKHSASNKTKSLKVFIIVAAWLEAKPEYQPHRVKQSHKWIKYKLQSLTWEFSQPQSAASLHLVLSTPGINMSQLVILIEMYIDFLESSNNQYQ